ncbi:hypothetical protein CWO33_23545 [Vibrio splendidus]|uniref:hypothetical protein n=1 Tax=Vibrio splendidus TaxID=29497 RepID=UPI000D3939B3|nr:hypothetical protein [Vibrio splendidus]PTQ05311.1 hypothetical protein CWO33_23545 [Vibrio splendidus]
MDTEKLTAILSKVFDALSLYVIAIVILASITYLACRYALRNIDHDFVKKWSDKLHSGYGNLIFIMASILWASSVSVFGTDIKDQVFDLSIPVSWETLSFFTTVYCSVVIGIYHYIGQQRKNREEQSRPPINAVKLAAKDTVELMQVLKTCILDWQAILNKPVSSNKEELDNLILLDASLRSAKRSCLNSLLNVASNWDDRDNDKVTYRANFFNLAPAKSVLEEFEKSNIVGPKPKNGGYAFNINSVINSPFFLFNDNWRSRLEKSDYIIVNEQELSVSLPRKAGAKEGLPICMPYSEVSAKLGDDAKQPNLHGAPLARQLKRPVYIPELKKQVKSTIEDLQDSPMHRDYINGKFTQNLYEYYEQDSTKSILSIPIYKYHIGQPFSVKGTIDKPVKDDDIIVCIANVYTNRNHMFNNDDMADSYCEIVKPIMYILSILVSMRVNLIEIQDILSAIDYDKNEPGDRKKEAA